MTYNPNHEELVLLSKTSIFRNLSSVELKDILSSACRVEVERRSFVYHQGEPAEAFYVILQGNARLTQITTEGRQVIMHYFGPGDAMATIVVLANVDYPVSAEAMTDCILLGWDRETTVQYMGQYPRLAINGMETVSARFWELQNRYRELATQRVERRVAHAILRLSNRGNGGYIKKSANTLILSRQDLAEMTGTTLFSVSRICSQWEQQGLLTTGRGQITLLLPEELTAIAEDIPC